MKPNAGTQSAAKDMRDQTADDTATDDGDEEAIRHLEQKIDEEQEFDGAGDSAESDGLFPDARTPEAREAALGRIRAFRDDTLLTLTYRCTAPNPYKDDDAKKVEIYADDRGNEYWIDPAGDVLVQAGPSARLHSAARKTRTEDRLSVSELRTKAVAIVEANVAGFAGRRSEYHPLEDNRNRETYFFRWDDFSQPAKESELPPFVQVGINADGSLASYTNTLRR